MKNISLSFVLLSLLGGCALYFEPSDTNVVIGLGNGSARSLSVKELTAGSSVTLRVDDQKGNLIQEKTFPYDASDFSLSLALEPGRMYKATAVARNGNNFVIGFATHQFFTGPGTNSIRLVLGWGFSGGNLPAGNNFREDVFEYKMNGYFGNNFYTFYSSTFAFSEIEFRVNRGSWEKEPDSDGFNFNFPLIPGQHLLEVRFLQESGEWAVYTFHINANLIS